MSFAIPTLTECVDRARRAFRTYLPGTDAWVWPNNIGPTAKVIAGAIYEVFGFADYVSRQKFAITADGENLDLHGEELGLTRRPAEPATGQVTLTSTGALAVVLGATFSRIDGVVYRTLASGRLLVAGDLTLDVIAMTDGKTTSAIGGTPLVVVDGVSGTATAAVAEDGIAGGTDVEDDEAFRARILFRKRNPPHGGAAADYVMWAESVSGVTPGRVFVERLWNGAGTVRVFPLMFDRYVNGIPAAPDVARVADYIDLVRPAGAVVTVQAPSAVVVNIEIGGLSPDTTVVREAILAELRAAFRRLARVAGNDTGHPSLLFLAVPATFSRSWIWQAVANATGEERHTINSPAADVALIPGQFPTLGTVTFV